MSSFEEVIKNIKSSDVVIRLHNFPDPDAIASAYGLQDLLLRKKGIRSKIRYSGKIDRESTSKMVEILNIETEETNGNYSCSPHTTVILVDSQKGNTNTSCDECLNVICIDHHPLNGSDCYSFSDIRPDVGACASIISEYFHQTGLEMDSNMATALLYGIKIDTANLTRGVSNLDLDMFYYLYKKADIQKLSILESSNMQLADLKAYMMAIKNIKVIGPVSFANTGDDCHEALIAMISDFTLSISEVQFSIVYSIKEDGIKISSRSKSDKFDAGKITKAALEGLGSGGGHPFMAGGFVPLKHGKRVKKSLIHKIEKGFLKNFK